jgi:DNA (cytosine-5)-methyltransferase 1
MRPKALDLFCGAGGAGMGLHRAGFEVRGVDLDPQPRYPFMFARADLSVAANVWQAIALATPDFIWASPPCQRWTPHAQQHGSDMQHPDLIEPIRAVLREWATHAPGRAWCIENVPRAPLRNPVVLTGCMFGLNTYRRRHFECNFAVLAPAPGKPFGPKTRPGSVTITGHSGGSSKRDGWSNGDKAAWQAAMGIDWMLNREMAEAIPPAYSEFIGRQALRFLDIPDARHAA